MKVLNEGGFIFLFDGFDEIANVDRDFVIKDLHRFIEKAYNNFFLITSRPDDSLSSFGDFKKFKIKPLKREEAYSLINRYDNYSHKSIANRLISELKNNNEESINEFLENPLLVSLLFKSFEYKKDLPIKKSQFYRQVYDALFESHDLSKEGYLKREKYSKLHIDDFDRVLRHIGYFTAIQNKVEYEINYILNIIDNVKKYMSDLLFKSSDFLKDLLETVPLFKWEGNNVKWSHKSLQDYFAAKFIWIDAKENQEKILKKIYLDTENSRFYNLLDLFYELDPQLFEKTIVYWILFEFKLFAENSFAYSSEIPTNLIKTRIENMFHKTCEIAISDESEYDVLSSGGIKSNKIFEQVSKKLSNPQITYSGVSYYYFETPTVVALTFYNLHPEKETILKLLNKIDNSIVTYQDHDHQLNNLEILERNSIYIVDDSNENILNKLEIFEIVNLLTVCNGYKINYDNAIAKLKSIEDRNAKKTEEELLNW